MKRKVASVVILILFCLLSLAAQDAPPLRRTHEKLHSTLWAQTSVEYRAACLEIYANATRMLLAALKNVTSPSCPSVSNRLSAPLVVFARYPSTPWASHLRGSGLHLSPAGSPAAPAESSSFPTDGQFTSCCSPPRLATAQLQSVSGRRTYAGRGLAPL